MCSEGCLGTCLLHVLYLLLHGNIVAACSWMYCYVSLRRLISHTWVLSVPFCNASGRSILALSSVRCAYTWKRDGRPTRIRSRRRSFQESVISRTLLLRRDGRPTRIRKTRWQAQSYSVSTSKVEECFIYWLLYACIHPCPTCPSQWSKYKTLISVSY